MTMYEELCDLSEKLREQPENRRKLLPEFDRIFSLPDSENSSWLQDFYAHRCREALAKIRAYRGDRPRLWKFYSSGVVVKSAGRAVMFDLTCGCECPNRTTKLMLPGEIIQEFAAVLDTGFVTHGHVDHMGAGLLRAMLARGKRVVIPRDAIDEWKLDGATPAEEYHEPGLRIIPLGQDLMTDEGMVRVCNAVYHYAPSPGVALLLKGDVYSGPDTEAIFAVLKEENLPLSHALFSPFYQSPPDPVKLAAEAGAAFIPIHEWEFSHRKPGLPGKATQDYAELGEHFAPYRATILTWGESVYLR